MEVKGYIEQFKAARRAAVPIVGIETVDQQGTVATITKAVNGDTPVILWDSIRGFSAITESAESTINQILGGNDPAMFTNPSEALGCAVKIKDRAVLFMSNAHHLLNPQKDFAMFVSQGIANLRDAFKAVGATLVLMAPGISLPDELKQDVMVLSEPLPTLEEIDEITKTLVSDFNERLRERKMPVIELTSAGFNKINDTMIGLSAFAAEQTLSTCLSKDGVDFPSLWERKCKAIEQTDGLSIWRGKERFDDLGGCENAKAFFRQLLKGRNAPRCIVFMDEVEKMFAGIQGDSSGTSQDQLGVILSWMQDKDIEGCILIGPAGAAKSAISKSVGNEGGIPTIVFDMGGMKDKFVGESGRKTRTALKVIDAISQGRVLVLATCNSIGVLPPELRRRFSLGTWFFDLPTEDERKLIWNIYLKKYELQGPLPNDDQWTGAEIRKCAMIAWRLNIPLTEAANYIVPVAKSAPEVLENLRRSAAGKFIDAGKKGIYQPPTAAKTTAPKRAIQ